MKEAIDKAGYTEKIVIGMDVAASEFHRDGKYDLDFKSPADPSRYITGDQLGSLYQDFVRDYPGESKAGYGRECRGGQQAGNSGPYGMLPQVPGAGILRRDRARDGVKSPAEPGLCME